MKLEGSEELSEVILEDNETLVRTKLRAEALIFRIGVTPNSSQVQGELETDSSGYIQVDSQCRTSLPGIYAVGDVANPTSPTIASATGMIPVAFE